MICMNINMSESDVPELFDIPVATGFKLPEHGSRELLEYIVSLTTPDGNSLFMKASYYIPTVDILKVVSTIARHNKESHTEELTKEKSLEIAQQLCFNRLANRICENCGDKSNIIKLQICQNCCLSWYCNKECQRNHWNKHKLRCCNRNGPLDDGYQAIMMLEIDK